MSFFTRIKAFAILGISLKFLLVLSLIFYLLSPQPRIFAMCFLVTQEILRYLMFCVCSWRIFQKIYIRQGVILWKMESRIKFAREASKFLFKMADKSFKQDLKKQFIPEHSTNDQTIGSLKGRTSNGRKRINKHHSCPKQNLHVFWNKHFFFL